MAWLLIEVEPFPQEQRTWFHPANLARWRAKWSSVDCHGALLVLVMWHTIR